MALRTKAPKIDPERIYVCHSTFFAADYQDGHVAVPAGRRLRGDDPIVRKWPHMFVEDGGDIGAAAAALYDRPAVPPAPDPLATRMPEPTPPEHQLLVRETK